MIEQALAETGIQNTSSLDGLQETLQSTLSGWIWPLIFVTTIVLIVVFVIKMMGYRMRYDSPSRRFTDTERAKIDTIVGQAKSMVAQARKDHERARAQWDGYLKAWPRDAAAETAVPKALAAAERHETALGDKPTEPAATEYRTAVRTLTRAIDAYQKPANVAERSTARHDTVIATYLDYLTDIDKILDHPTIRDRIDAFMTDFLDAYDRAQEARPTEDVTVTQTGADDYRDALDALETAWDRALAGSRRYNATEGADRETLLAQARTFANMLADGASSDTERDLAGRKLYGLLAQPFGEEVAHDVADHSELESLHRFALEE